MAEAFYLTRDEIAAFLPSDRARYRFDLMQRTVSETQEAATANIEATNGLKEATYVTLSPNTELPNERVFTLGTGLRFETVDADTVRIGVNAQTVQTNGNYLVTLTAEGPSTVAVPLTGYLATRSNAETLSNKTLAAPLLSGLGDYADDTAAAAGGVPVGGVYRTASALKVRVA